MGCRSELKYNQTSTMTAIFKGLFRWSLEITGVSIIWYNYQPYERQQKIQGIYGFLKNSYHFTRCLYGLSQDLKTYTQNTNNESLALFRTSTAKRLEELCQKNLGAYARIGQVLAGYTDIMPQQYTNEFKKLSEITLEGTPYAEIKSALTSIYQKDTKELFDGFQTKPLGVGLFTQTHKAVLLQNYREAVVKVLLPSTKIQAEHDIWFINKVKDHVVDYLKKNNIKEDSYKVFLEALAEAQSVVNSEVNLERQLENTEKTKPLMYESNSAFYVPYYFTKLCNQNVIIRQLIDGVRIGDTKGLKELGLTPEVAYAYVLSQVHHLMKRLHLISGSLSPDNIMLRKYIKPYKPPVADSEIEKEEARQAKKKAKPTPFIHPPYQVVFLAQNNLQEIPAETTEDITSFWNNLKKDKKKVLPSVTSFYERMLKYQQLKGNYSALMAQRYFLYEPLLKIYENLVKKE